MSAAAVMVPPVSPKRRGRSSRQTAIRSGPRKGGHGGWGKVGEEGWNYELFIGDPNFDDADEYVEGVPADFAPSKRMRKNSSITFEVSTPRIAPHEMESFCRELIRQYFMNEDLEDYVLSLEKLKLAKNDMGELVSYAVEMSMDYYARERELTSKLISGLSDTTLSAEAIRKGFNQLLMGVDSLVVDCPGAADMLAKFLARAVADDCLAPSFLKQLDGLGACARQVVSQAGKLLTGPHGMARLDMIWGQTGGSISVEELEKCMSMLIKECVSSSDIKEAVRCLVELNVPHYHHEAIYQLFYNALQNGDSGDILLKLLKTLKKTSVCSEDQISQGVKRIFADAADISLDVPFVFQNLECYVTDAYNLGCITKETYSQRPRKSRKRYISEGDGGRYRS